MQVFSQNSGRAALAKPAILDSVQYVEQNINKWLGSINVKVSDTVLEGPEARAYGHHRLGLLKMTAFLKPSACFWLLLEEHPSACQSVSGSSQAVQL